MPIITSPPQPTHDLGGTRFTAHVSPSRGSATTAIWQVEIDPGTPATPHAMTEEEVFVVLDGTATVRLGDEAGEATVGDAIVIPAGTTFELSNAASTPLRLLCCMTFGGEAVLPDGSSFVPPWTA
jgi:mannose-6-phosphate isomerase-like protein (cupin superfamily)